MMWHIFFFGLVLGWGAAIPVGPVNIEMVRRNLGERFWAGTWLGFGASSVDTIYLILLCLGVLVFLTHPVFLDIVTILGAFVLAWFGYRAFRAPVAKSVTGQLTKHKVWYRHWAEGVVMTVLSPYNILFWASVSTQLANISKGGKFTIAVAGLGVICATCLWTVALNVLVHFTRHKLSERVIIGFNRSGAVLLWAFALFGLVHVALQFGA